MDEKSFECELCTRISLSDAHYAGNLIDGAHIMKLFGDVATNLTIQIDGDEGLLRAYDYVEFLSPVYAGDFLIVKGKTTKIGNTSRKILFEAYKIIEAMPNEKFESKCKTLKPPLLVAKASGTTVVIKEKQINKKNE
tara:strand:+ start:299 stop:709 length:411 start_codon:yes stop_codon:yes gene_type:complete